MLELVDHVAALTEHRDRESLDSGLARTFMVLFNPVKVAIFGVIGDAKDQRWLPLVAMKLDSGVEKFNPMHADFRLLEPLRDAPNRWQIDGGV